jgi:hypothetical protein
VQRLAMSTHSSEVYIYIFAGGNYVTRHLHIVRVRYSKKARGTSPPVITCVTTRYSPINRLLTLDFHVNERAECHTGATTGPVATYRQDISSFKLTPYSRLVHCRCFYATGSAAICG